VLPGAEKSMHLPGDLLAAIQGEIAKTDRATLARASVQLTQHYKAENSSEPIVKSEALRSAYLAVRLPATYAAARAVFSEVGRLASDAAVESILDLGAGPGTALWAAAETFPALRHATLVESDDAWLKIGKRLAGYSLHPWMSQAQWIRHDLRTELLCPPHDLVVLSYSLGELSPEVAEALLRQAWIRATKFVAIIEPGTMRGFMVVNRARSALIAAGAEILAPCPHCDACPMAAAGDWCHFSRRLQRTSLHRQLKGAALGYEDEKFSYVVSSRQTCAPVASRIVRHPQKHRGHVQLALCTPRGLETRVVSRSQRGDYQSARQAEWGGAWSE
jgi:ribosomal protein RSM22 (predicted rRNA methylase)